MESPGNGNSAPHNPAPTPAAGSQPATGQAPEQVVRQVVEAADRLLEAHQALQAQVAQQKSRWEEHIRQVTEERDEARKAETLARDFAAETQLLLDEAEREIARLLQERAEAETALHATASAVAGASVAPSEDQGQGSTPHNIQSDRDIPTLSPEAIEALVQEIDACIALLQR